jgi:hypothetical protein
MASLATVDANIAIALGNLSTSPTRFGSDLRDNLDPLASGATKFQLRADHLTEVPDDANQVYESAEIVVVMVHELTTPSSERTYTKGNMLADQGNLNASSWWRAITGIHDVVEGPTRQSDAEREGNTITYSMAVSILITP